MLDRSTPDREAPDGKGSDRTGANSKRPNRERSNCRRYGSGEARLSLDLATLRIHQSPQGFAPFLATSSTGRSEKSCIERERRTVWNGGCGGHVRAILHERHVVERMVQLTVPAAVQAMSAGRSR